MILGRFGLTFVKGFLKEILQGSLSFRRKPLCFCKDNFQFEHISQSSRLYGMNLLISKQFQYANVLEPVELRDIQVKFMIETM